MMKHNIFYHLNCGKVAYLLGDRKPDGVRGSLDGWQVREKNSYQAMYNRIDIK